MTDGKTRDGDWGPGSTGRARRTEARRDEGRMTEDVAYGRRVSVLDEGTVLGLEGDRVPQDPHTQHVPIQRKVRLELRLRRVQGQLPCGRGRRDEVGDRRQAGRGQATESNGWMFDK